MAEVRSESSPSVLLVYIPCHADYKMALVNLRRIRDQQKHTTHVNDSKHLIIKTALSINGVNISEGVLEEFRELTDHLIYYKESIGGDLNIAQGFMLALQNRPDFFWILSASEILKPDVVLNLSKKILGDEVFDIIVTNSEERESIFQMTNIFLDLPKGLRLGLISGVIYNFKKTEFAFPAAAKFSWTGWGQLAVIQEVCLANGKVNVSEIPESRIYEKPFTFDHDENLETNSQTEFEVVRVNYHHSFFGMPILIASLFSRTPKIRKKIMSKWIRDNWFRMRYFSRGVDFNSNENSPHLDAHWIRRISEPLFYDVGPFSTFLSFLGKNLPLEKLRNANFVHVVRKVLKK